MLKVKTRYVGGPGGVGSQHSVRGFGGFRSQHSVRVSGVASKEVIARYVHLGGDFENQRSVRGSGAVLKVNTGYVDLGFC